MQLLPLRFLSWKQPSLLPIWYCPSSFYYRKLWSDEVWLVIHEVGFIKKAAPHPTPATTVPPSQIGCDANSRLCENLLSKGKTHTRWGINYWRGHPFQPIYFIAINRSQEYRLVHWDQGQDLIPGLLTLHPLFIHPVITSLSPAGQQTPQGQEPLPYCSLRYPQHRGDKQKYLLVHYTQGGPLLVTREVSCRAKHQSKRSQQKEREIANP